MRNYLKTHRVSNPGDKMKDEEATIWRAGMQIPRGSEGDAEVRSLKVTNKGLRLPGSPSVDSLQNHSDTQIPRCI